LGLYDFGGMAGLALLTKTKRPTNSRSLSGFNSGLVASFRGRPPPLAFMVIPEPTLVIVTFVIVANSAFGLICGYLYWKKGLESAIIGHMVGHIVMFTATYLGL
jgi:hypothetical protein